MRHARLVVVGILVCLGLAPPAPALETDQYYAWNREIADAAAAFNAKINHEVERVLDAMQAEGRGDPPSCRSVTRRLGRHFRQFIFHDVEVWALNSALVDRVPADVEEELSYRELGLFAIGGPFDIGGWVPPSPTIELDGIRLGTDKLSHFFSEGWLYYRWLRSKRERGLDEAEIERRIVRRGILLEKTVLGLTSSGVFSVGDLEANYQGMLFFDRVCSGERPLLEARDDGWVLVRPFDIADYVSPEWDESYNPSVYRKRRWRKALPILETYCPLLHDPAVDARRSRYAARDRVTPTERELARYVEAGRLPDPRGFGLDAACAASDDRGSAVHR